MMQVSTGDGPSDRDVHVRSRPALRFHGGGVLDAESDEPAQVLDDPADELGTAQRVPTPLADGTKPGRRCLIGVDLAVGVQGEGREVSVRSDLPPLSVRARPMVQFATGRHGRSGTS